VVGEVVNFERLMVFRRIHHPRSRLNFLDQLVRHSRFEILVDVSHCILLVLAKHWPPWLWFGHVGHKKCALLSDRKTINLMLCITYVSQSAALKRLRSTIGHIERAPRCLLILRNREVVESRKIRGHIGSTIGSSLLLLELHLRRLFLSLHVAGRLS